MKVNNAFSPVSEKHVKSEVKLMSWSPKFDLLAVTTVNGELILYRLVSKERIWNLPAPDASVGIHTICWRPDGKLIAVSYDVAKHGIQFIAMEKPTKIGQFSLEKDVTSTMMKWMDIDHVNIPKPSNMGEELTSDDYLPKIPVWEFESKDKTKNFGYLEHGKFNILLVCDSSNHVTLLANGTFPIIKISCADGPDVNQQLIAAHMSPNMENMSVVRIGCKENARFSYVQMYDLKNLAKNMGLYEAAADKVYKILSLEAYLNEIITNVGEQCDMVAQEMDSHLVSYLTKSASSDRIGDDFMQLLMWGKPTQALTDILTTHMTKRGIKKLGLLIDSSYTNIQQDLTLNFQNGLMNLYYHLTEIKGMVADGKHALPFCVEDTDELISTAGSLLLKTVELLHVIDTSLKNFKAFFRWLYISMLKMQDEPVDKLGNVSMNEMAFVADFIYEHLSFRRQGEKKTRQFQLEKVYQYLKDEPLTSPIKNTQNEWLNFVASSTILSNCKLMIQPYPELSLRQIFNVLSDQLDKVIRQPKFSENQNYDLVRSVKLSKTSAEEIPKAQFLTRRGIDGANKTYLFFAEKDTPCPDATLFYLGSQNLSLPDLKALKLYVSHSGDDTDDVDPSKRVKIQDFATYNENTITCILLEEISQNSRKYFLAQVDLTSAFEALQGSGVSPESLPFQTPSYVGMTISSVDISDSAMDVRELSKKAGFVCVATSGSRKVSCALSLDRHTIQPFLMDGTEEEEDDSILEEDGE